MDRVKLIPSLARAAATMRRSQALANEAWINSIDWAESEGIWEPGNRENMLQPAREWEDDAHRHFFWSLNNSREFGRDDAYLILNLYEVHNLLGYERLDEHGDLIEWVMEPSNIRNTSPIGDSDTNIVTRMNRDTLMDVWNNRIGVELGQVEWDITGYDLSIRTTDENGETVLVPIEFPPVEIPEPDSD